MQQGHVQCHRAGAAKDADAEQAKEDAAEFGQGHWLAEEQYADQHTHQRGGGVEDRRIAGRQHLGRHRVEGGGDAGVDHAQHQARAELALEVPAHTGGGQYHDQAQAGDGDPEERGRHRAQFGGDDAHEQETRSPDGGKGQQAG
ncbi:hypothetical protein D3C80_1727780 [compost metagenome]